MSQTARFRADHQALLDLAGELECHLDRPPKLYAAAAALRAA